VNKDKWRAGVAEAIADSVDRNVTAQTEGEASAAASGSPAAKFP